MPNTHQVPRINFSAIAITKQDADISDQEKLEVGEKLLSAFTEIGFCYMLESGIKEKTTADCVKASERFFALPVDTKKKYLRKDPENDFNGWLPSPQIEGVESLKFKPEHFDESHPIDFKEAINLQRTSPDSICPSVEEISGFTDATIRVMDQLDVILRRCLEALGHALNLDDPKALLYYFKRMGTPDNESQFRYNLYPKLRRGTLQENQMRCCEHTDFSFLTFLFQNETPGLQVFTREEKYIDVEPVDGAILINIGDSLERVTGGILRSAKHQVVVNEELAKSDRYSVAYFTLGDEESILEAFCGEKEKYGEKISTREFKKRRFGDIYRRKKGLGTNTG